MKPVLIIVAMPQEMVLLEQTLHIEQRIHGIAFDYAKTSLGSMPVFICAAGIGKINAAAATATLIEQCKPELVINTGCAGAYHTSALAKGDIAVASQEILGDEGVQTSKKWLDMEEIGIPTVVQGQKRFFNELPMSKHAAEKAMRLAEYCGVQLVRGPFITISTCSGSRERGDELARKYNAICENMEGAAVAQICLRYKVDCLEIRGISNLVEERNMDKWDIPVATEAAQRFVLKYIEDLEKSY